jgi:Fic family protein
MITINKYEPLTNIEDAFNKYISQYNELNKIFEFIDLPESIIKLEEFNSVILRNYYANAIDNNLLDIKQVKQIIESDEFPQTVAEAKVYLFDLAEQFLFSKVDQPISVGLVYKVNYILNLTNYSHQTDIETLFIKDSLFTEKLDENTEQELETLFNFLNSDSEFHPIVQSWMLHFKIISLPMFLKSKNMYASLFQSFWLKKHQMDMNGLLSLEHELYINKQEYETYFLGNNTKEIHLKDQLEFGLSLYSNQLTRLYQLLQSYFHKQINYSNLKPRQKNIMNFVFKQGYKLKEVDDDVLNQRQKLIMYLIQHRGYVSTKDLAIEFDCNRKTIQRDFLHLTELNFVKTFGQGSALKYCLNMDLLNHDPINQYQSSYLVNSDEYIELEQSTQ